MNKPIQLLVTVVALIVLWPVLGCMMPVAYGTPALPLSADTNDSPSVIVSWNPTNNPIVAGYNVYYGGTSGAYTNKTDCGTNTTLAIYNLAQGFWYYFAATTYSKAGAESALSKETAWPLYAYKLTNQIFQIWQGTNRLLNVNNPTWVDMFFRMSNGCLQASLRLPPAAGWNNITQFGFTNTKPLSCANIMQYKRTP